MKPTDLPRRARRLSLVSLLSPVCLMSLVCPLSLGSCGFEPLYARGDASPTADLPDIYVGYMLGRFGQIMREDIQQHLDSNNSGAGAPYEIDVVAFSSGEGVAVQPDNSSTFTRLVGVAGWTLRTTDMTPRILATGTARTVDGNNNIDQEYFQSQESGDATSARIAANLAGAITLQVAAWFKREHLAGDPHLHPVAGTTAPVVAPGPTVGPTISPLDSTLPVAAPSLGPAGQVSTFKPGS